MAVESFFVGEIDTSAPFESVREAATRFGGFGFWKPSSHDFPRASQNDVVTVEKAGELEKKLIAKEGETFKVLKSLESTKATVEDLKSKLQRKDEKEICDMNVLKELNRAKTDLSKTTENLSAIRDSIELLNKRLEDERYALETENAAEFSVEIQRLSSHEAKEFNIREENAVDKAVAEIKQTRKNKIKNAQMRLVAARKMKEAARAAEAVAIAEIKAVTRKRGNGEEKNLEGIEEEDLEKVNTAKKEAEETLQEKWQWSEDSEQRRRSSSSYTGKYKNPSLQQNRRETLMMDVNGLSPMMNGYGASSSVAVLKPTMSIGQILSRKLLLADESAMMMMMMNGRVSLRKTNNGDGSRERKEKEKRLNVKRKSFGFAKLSVLLNYESKKKKLALNLR